MRTFTLKAKNRGECEGIILTFHSKWKEALLSGDVGVVFRKMGPTWFVPRFIYAYMSAPVSAIVARTPVIDYQFISNDKAIERAQEGKIDRQELLAYADNYSQLLVIEIGTITLAKVPITFSQLSDTYGFWPSSTFIPLSHIGMDALDSLGQFGTSRCGS